MAYLRYNSPMKHQALNDELRRLHAEFRSHPNPEINPDIRIMSEMLGFLLAASTDGMALCFFYEIFKERAGEMQDVFRRAKERRELEISDLEAANRILGK